MSALHQMLLHKNGSIYVHNNDQVCIMSVLQMVPLLIHSLYVDKEALIKTLFPVAYIFTCQDNSRV